MQEITKDLTDYRLALKERILETAMAAFGRKGVKAVKMDDIAAALSISKRTLYEIYGDKETLLYEGISKREKQCREHLQTYAEQGHNVMEILQEAYRENNNASRDVCLAFYEDLHRYPKVEQYIRESRAGKRKEVLDFMHLGVQQGFFRPDIDYGLFILLFESLTDTIVREKLLFTHSMDELFFHFFLIPLRGICTDQGLTLVQQTWK